MGNYTQTNRLLKFSSHAGDDVLLPEGFSGVEGVSRLFDYHIDLLAETGTEIDPTDLVGNKVTVELALLDTQGIRYFNGIVASLEQTAGDTTFDHYRAHIVPSLWQLTLATNCRVFQDKTVMEVIKEVISPYALSVGDSTRFEYKPLDYCTQFNETDFDFITRLMEQFGIFYWFEHTDTDNKVTFGDNRDAYTPCPETDTVQYSAQFEDNETMYHSVVSDVRATSTMVTGKHSSRAWDFQAFKGQVRGPQNSGQTMGKNALECYEYPTYESGYIKANGKMLATPAHGDRMIEAWADASDVESTIFRGTSTARTFIPGFTYTLTDHPKDSWNQSYYLTEVVHHCDQQPSYQSEQAGVRMPYTNRFIGIEAERVFRPEETIERPTMPGPQVAVVVAPDGEEQWMDSLGRINVRFMWDRTATIHGTDSTWVRVAQSWASHGYGTYFWPRINDEVLVDFIDGDPDEPLVVGSLYNGHKQPKYPLPDMQTRSGIKTRSTKGGGDTNANELRFEDKMGSEQIFINAERDWDLRVEHDRRDYTMAQHSLIVDGKYLEQIGGERHTHYKDAVKEQLDKTFDQTITGAVTQKYAAKFGLEVGADAAIKYDAKLGVETGDDAAMKYGGKLGVNVSKAADFKYGDSVSMSVSQNLGEKVGMNYAVDAGMEAYIKGGMNVTIEAGMSLTLKGPGGFINIGPAGVAISGTMVLINSGGAAGSGTAPTINDPAAPDSPTAPQTPDDPDKADDSTKGGKM